MSQPILRWILLRPTSLPCSLINFKLISRNFASKSTKKQTFTDIHAPLVHSALSNLQAKIEAKELKFPYNSLNSFPAQSLLSEFEKFKKIVRKKSLELKEHKGPFIPEYVDPHLSMLPKLLYLINNDTYPKTFTSIRNLNTKEAVLTELLSALFLRHYNNAVLKYIENTSSANEYYGLQRCDLWYPEARKMRRKLIMHVGPTNSGKTHNALKQFSVAKTGYYAGPLRMLAREVYERFISQGVSCNLITGEEIIPSIDEFGVLAGLSAGTIEMLPLHKKMDICIIDEIQMLEDDKRGCAWTSAVLGVQAKEVHLCGEERAVELIKKIADTTGEELEIRRYNRLGNLRVMGKSLKTVSDLRAGDCVVFFSKKKILEFKCKIENATDLKVGVIYGALPPEVRLQESTRFNSGEYDVLVASDAIGMGINLKIKRVVFGQTDKFDGSKMIPLSPSSVKQIGGRAGRYSTSSGELEGLITAFKKKDLDYVREIMSQDIPPIEKAGIWPPDEFWLHYLGEPQASCEQTLSLAIRRFKKEFSEQPSTNYFLMDTRTKAQMPDFLRARKLDEVLTIDNQLRLALVPINLSLDAGAAGHVFKILGPIVNKEPKTIFELGFLNLHVLGASRVSEEDKTEIYERLEILEMNHKLTLVFLWLAQRWPSIYIDKTSASEVKALLEKRISEELAQLRDTKPIDKEPKSSDYKTINMESFVRDFEKTLSKKSKVNLEFRSQFDQRKRRFASNYRPSRDRF